MTKRQTIYYQADLWPAVCKVRGYKKTDREKRLELILICMIEVDHDYDPVRLSSKDLTPAQVTALFTYLQHVAEPNNIDLIQRWEDCKADYIAFHQSKIADWWQSRAYGQGGGQIVKQRFNGRPKAHGAVFGENALDRKKSGERLMTMRNRARAKTRKYQMEEPY